jgi:hypothetical protein
MGQTSLKKYFANPELDHEWYFDLLEEDLVAG